MLLKPGTCLGPYEIVTAIEAGGMGSVFKGRDRRLGREVALKVLPLHAMRDERLVKRFTREARAAAALTHPNVVTIYDVGEDVITVPTPFGPEKAAIRFLVEEFVPGASLRKVLRGGRPPLKRIIELSIGISRGLVAAHEKGLIHRDLKPENVLVDASGTPKIADFGLVRWIYPDTAAPPSHEDADSAIADPLTRTGFVVGTLGYMSPEQARGEEIGPPSDLFVFGILIYEMLTGIAPFARDDVESSFHAILRESPQHLLEIAPDTPIGLVKIVERCLAKDIASRYPMADAILRDLERLRRELRLDREGGDTRTAIPAAASPTRTPASPRPLPPPPSGAGAGAGVLLSAAAAVLLAFGGGYAVGSRRPATAAPESAGTSVASSWAVMPLRESRSSKQALEPALDPQGLRWAFTLTDGITSEIWTAPLRARGSELRASGERGGRAPFFAPDGRTLVFASTASGGTPDGSGSGASPAAAEAAGSSGADGPDILEVELGRPGSPRVLVSDGDDPAISPDGKSLVFVRRKDGGTHLLVASRDGSGARVVVQAANQSWQMPVFRGDGRAVLLYDVEPVAGSATLLTVSLDEKRAVPFLSPRLDPGCRAVPLADGSILARLREGGQAVLLTEGARAPTPLPLGAGLSALTSSADARLAITGSGSDLFLWRR